jgi:hypothetical protein
MTMLRILGTTRGGKCTLLVVQAIALALAIAPAGTAAAGSGAWWNVTPEEETQSSQYDSILYSEIAPKLREIEVNSARVKIDVIGQSSGGRNLFLATVSTPKGNLGGYKAIQKMMLSDPATALSSISSLNDLRVPVLLLAGVHGNEYPTVDAAIRLIETLAYDFTDPEVQTIMDNLIVLVIVVGNPDGRVMGTRLNAGLEDLGEDFMTQSQPETQAFVRVITEWNPMVMLDLHGFVDPMLIEPCSPWHNPNYEYDLYLKWAFDEAEAMEAELFTQTGLNAQIPYRDLASGWDDWDPIYPAMYAMFHGAYAHTIETPHFSESGVDALYAAVWGALKYASANQIGMLSDQIEIFRRGALGLPQQLIPAGLLAKTIYDQNNSLTVVDFPAAYVIPAQATLQQNPSGAASLVDFLLFNGVQVEKANSTFMLGGTSYPKGTYIVWMDQPKRGLANTVLWTTGPLPVGLPTPSAHPLVTNVSISIMDTWQDVKTSTINKAK